MVMGVLVGAGLVLIAGRLLVRRLGLPTDVGKAVTWGAVLLVGAIALGSLRSNRRRLSLPENAFGAGDVFVVVFIVILALIGHQWLKAHLEGRTEDRTGTQARQRALPPAPYAPAPGPDEVPPAP
jgi:hypothetical protein